MDEHVPICDPLIVAHLFSFLSKFLKNKFQFFFFLQFFIRNQQQKTLQEYCYFYETMVNGWFRFYSASDDTKHIGFTRNGRAIRFHNRTTRPYENCFNFVKYPSDTKFAMEKSTTTILPTKKLTKPHSQINVTTTLPTANLKPKPLHTSIDPSLQANRIGEI